MELFPQDNRSNYVNVTDQFVSSFTSEAFTKLVVETAEIDLVFHKADKFGMKVFMLLPNEASLLHIDSKFTDELLRCTIKADKKNLKAYVVISVPVCRELIVKSGDGDIDIHSISAETVKISSQTGDVSATIKKGSSFSIKTESGDINIAIPPKVFKISAKSECGEVTKIGVKSFPASKKKITCLSDSGDILIKNIN